MMQPLPLEVIRAKVLRPTESPYPKFYCCICRQREAPRTGVCANPQCQAEAHRLDWYLP
jgi:hypothetical protein